MSFGLTSTCGRKHTPESKQKISDANKGKPSPFKGKKHTIETRQKMRLAQLGNKSHRYGIHLSKTAIEKIRQNKLKEKNPNWKGDTVSYIPLHRWVRRHLLKPELCEICKVSPPFDLANITGNYNRDFINWQYMCRRCHMLSDGRMLNLRQFKSDK